MHIATIFNVPKNYLVGNYMYVRNFVAEGWGGGFTNFKLGDANNFSTLLHSKKKQYFRAPFLVLQVVTNRGLYSVTGPQDSYHSYSVTGPQEFPSWSF